MIALYKTNALLLYGREVCDSSVGENLSELPDVGYFKVWVKRKCSEPFIVEMANIVGIIANARPESVGVAGYIRYVGV